jgi:two-component system nitrate/nitrite response regulator NarL
MNRIRLLIVEGHPAVRQALAERLGSCTTIEVVGAADDFVTGQRLARALRPDVILLELKISGPTAPAAIFALAAEAHEWPVGIIVLTSYTDAEERAAALKAGARRYLLKDIASDRLIAEIQAVAAELSATAVA